MKTKAQPWIFSASFDIGLILAPAIIITALVIIFHDRLASLSEIPPWLWLLLIVGVDVSHVYSSIFRTYLDREELAKRQALYILTPLLCWTAGCLLYSMGSLVFWRVLAYLAVFHFIRQQYGFMMLYSRQEKNVPNAYRVINQMAIYSATLYPLIYWHCHARQFEWFIQGDFISVDAPLISAFAAVVYAAVLTAYVIKEIALWKETRTVNIPRNLLLFGTAFSWFVGIVAFNNDLAFTATNVIAHGVPYLALIWIYGYNQAALDGRRTSYLSPWISKLFRWRMVPLYIAVLFVLAFLEEGFWNGFVWREHRSMFGFFDSLPAVKSDQTLKWLVPLLALPQMTHYMLDAFIWQMKPGDNRWKQILFHHTRGQT